MRNQTGKAGKVVSQTMPSHQILATLEMSGVPADQIVALAERQGVALEDLNRWAEDFLHRSGSVQPAKAALVLVFGSVRQWQPLVPQAKLLGAELLRLLLIDSPGFIQSLVKVLDSKAFDRFRRRVLRRLGHPMFLVRSLRANGSTQEQAGKLIAWLEAGQPLVAYELEFRDFKATSPNWGKFHTPWLVLQDGHGPTRLCWSSSLIDLPQQKAKHGLLLERVSGVQDLEGDSYGWVQLRENEEQIAFGGVVLKACPDLVRLHGVFEHLEIHRCPLVQTVAIGYGSKRLKVLDCSALRSIQSWSDQNLPPRAAGEENHYELDELLIEGCGRLRSLPPRLRINQRLHLHDVGPIEHWPWDFQVGETLLISDCPRLESLPPVEVGGSLIVTGNSGLRRISPGTVVGKNLDLRACSQLESIPRGVRVGGAMYLPEHLNHRQTAHSSAVIEETDCLETAHQDLYEDVRSLLMAHHFPTLTPVQGRVTLRERAADILDQFRLRLAEEPRLESHLMWTASEAWRDLAEEAWAASNPMHSICNESDEDLPMAWFLSLLQKGGSLTLYRHSPLSYRLMRRRSS
jgi:hypothetical protein